MVTAIVLGISIPLAVVTCTFLLTRFGIKVNYNKTFTIKDERQTHTPEALKELETALNAPQTKTTSVREDNNNEPNDTSGGPMGSVIAEIQDLFGPDVLEEGKNER